MPRGHKPSPEIVTQIHDLRSQGMIQSEIAKNVGLCNTTVGRYLRPELRARLHRPEQQAKFRHRRIHNRVTTTINGVHGIYRVKKRPRPESCEFCTLGQRKLSWHHWDDSHLELGLWLCWKCHSFAESIERGLNKSHIRKYLELKTRVNKGEL